MKKIILLLMLCCMGVAFSQNIPPQPLPIDWSDTTLFASPHQTRFVLGWQWGSAERKVNQRFGINIFNDKFMYPGNRNSTFPTISDTGAPSDIGWEGFKIPEVDDVWGFSAPSLQFDPDAPQAISYTQPVRPGDKTGAVLGFGERDMRIGTLLSDTNNINFNRYLLRKDSLTGSSALVLSGPVVNDQYGQNGGNLINSGRQWYISINLRRTDDFDTLSGSQPVLTIKVPFERENNLSPGEIIFDRIAVSSATTGNLETLPFGRGLALKLQPAPNNITKEFVITRDMLPREGMTGTLPRDITISAFFRFKSSFDTSAQNDPLVGLTSANNRISKLKLEVYYHGNNNIAIDWLRFETPFSRSLFRGYEDTTRFLRYVRYNIDTLLRNAINGGLNARFKNFYGADEPPAIEWRGQRYYRQLFNDRFMTEVYNNVIKYAVGYKYPWMATMPRVLQGSGGYPPTMPFIKYGGDASHLSLKRGMDSTSVVDGAYQPDGSTYETYLDVLRPGIGWRRVLMGDDDILQPNHKDSLPYPDYLNYDTDGGPLAAIEGSAYGLSKEEVLYDGSKWWTNIQGQHEWLGWKVGSQTYLENRYRRPQTGEEIRIPMWMCLILGGKGMLYDRMFTMPLADAGTLTSGSSSSMTAGMMGYDTTTLTNNMTGEQLIQGVEAGSDFIELNDYTNLDSYIDREQIATNLGVDSNRIYIGRRSTRRELMKMHDFIHANETTLMKLRLAAWYGKGYGIAQSNNGSLELQNFLRVGLRLSTPPFSGLGEKPGFNTPLTRPVGRVNQGQPYPEPWDSAFVDYTILRDTGIATTDIFYTAVLNRRTNPLVRWPNGSGGDSLRFFTTAEFDSISAADPSWRYKQGGARTITIPFSVNNSSGYALLRVQELGGGIDTIVGQDKNLEVNFLPGEGKIFKVTVLPPDNSTAGLLSYSNQRKMVAVPIDGNMDSVRYHMTYYKNIPVLPPSPPRLGVYYRRSMPTNGKTNEENIKWEPGEELISKYITTPNGIDSTCDCMYPAITARYDSSNAIMTTYVVYNCKENLVTVSQSDVMIAETKFASERNRMLPITPLYGQFLDDVAGKDSSLWGIPSINASAQGNYYAWNDSTLGIAIGYKTPGAATFSIPRKYISWYNPSTYPGITAHPSLNTYSHISWNENDCAVVWQEGQAPYTQIYYARPYYNTFFGSVNLIRMTGGIGIARNSLEINNDSTILKVSNAICTQDNKFPVVYRAIESTLGMTGIYPSQSIYSRDRIAWEGNTMYQPYDRIFYRMLDFAEYTSPIPPITKTTSYWLSRNYSGIYAMRRGLYQPDISQGSYRKLGSFINNSDRAMVLSFVQGAFLAQAPSSSSLMWHVPMRLWSNLAQADNNTITDSRTKGIALSGNGQLSHLAARPDLTDSSQWKQTRRIYEKGTGAPPTIAETAQHFYRTGINTAEQAIVAPGFAYDCMPLIIIDPTVDEMPLRFNTPEPIVDTALNVTLPPADTIRTNWFTIGSSAELTTYFHGTDTSNVRLELVERTTMSVVVTPIPLETSTDSTVQEIKYTFLNGGNSEYRLEFMKTHNDAEFIEDILVGELDIDSVGSPRAGAGNSKGRHVFDLTKKAVKGTSSTDGLYISSYPNPVQDEITITCSQDAESLERNGRGFYSRNEITLAISDPVGRTIANYTLSPGASVTVPTQNLPSGVYIIRASGSIFGKASATFIVQH